ncbi:MAG: 6-phosphogluconolactonase [Terriglobia bacterium]
MRGTLVVCANFEQLCREAARRIVATVGEPPARRRCHHSVALAGGTTPRGLYELLASEGFRSRIPWPTVHFFWGDERLVPLDHPESNYRMARDALLRHVPVPRANIHPVPVHLAAEQAAESYEQELRGFFRRRRGVPSFDLILLGLGADGHTASLFPGAASLRERERLVVAARASSATPRVTLTLPVLNQARRVFFLVAGEEKAAALAAAVEGTDAPGGRVAPAKGELVWLVVAAAASRLKQPRVRFGSGR